MQIPLVSVIVPIYKAEKWLHRCVDSILAQTMEDFELLLIDDGSPDKSGEICDEYAEKDSRVRVFHKENGGVSSARALGVREANGEYSIHVDSDDYIAVNMLEEMVEKVQELDCDVLMCDYYEKREDVIIYNKQQPKSLNSKEILKEMLVCDIDGYLWNKLVRHRLYEVFGLRFYENINVREDLLIWVQLFCKNTKVAYLDKAYYYYVISDNENSLTSKYTKKHYEWYSNFICRLKEFLSADKIYEVEIIRQEADNYLHAYLGGAIALKELKQKMTIKHMWCYLFRNKHQSIRMKLVIFIKRFFYC